MLSSNPPCVTVLLFIAAHNQNGLFPKERYFATREIIRINAALRLRFRAFVLPHCHTPLNRSTGPGSSHYTMRLLSRSLLTCFFILLCCHAFAGRYETVETGFENLPRGEFQSISTAVGTFRNLSGPSLIESAHARSGKGCLQLAGPLTIVQLDLADTVDPAGTLSFYAERWTSRGPFKFIIESTDGQTWKRLFDGTRSVVVGRGFKSFVKISLAGSKAQALRFLVESPGNSGVLLDDLRISPPQQQKIVSAELVDEQLPVLLGRDSSPLGRLAINTEGELNPLSLNRIEITLDGTTDLEDLSEVEVRLGESWDSGSAEVLASTTAGKGGTIRIDLAKTASEETGTAFAEGRNDLWLGCRLAADANIDHCIGLRIDKVVLSDRSELAITGPKATLRRLGVAVRQSGQDKIHTYRIPGLATTNKGTLIGVYDNRRSGGYDLPGDIDVGMSRSTDGGRTWEPMKVIMDMGRDAKWRHDGIGDPAVLVDRGNNTIWVAGLWSHGNRGWNGSGPGLSPEETGQFILVNSTDDGVTWSAPVNITGQVKNPDWTLMLQGPGKGITMSDGTLVFPAQFRSSASTGKVPHSTIIWSKDHGKTWNAGTGAFPHTTESQVIEVSPGVLMLNCRYDRKSLRVVMTTRDLGQSWDSHPTSQLALIEPRACMASLINVGLELRQIPDARILFSNPDHPNTRMRMMIKASADGGLTWPEDHRVLLDSGRSAGYSCMTMVDENTVGILYEGSQAHMTFQRIPLKELF